MAGGRNAVIYQTASGGTSIVAKSKHPERALMVYELIRQDPEVYRLMIYGLETQKRQQQLKSCRPTDVHWA
ncbi:hypothetical protein SAMN04487897_101259 [Paenibacillus sp. yr247]|uniref:hypothetical protein n=1 Tax=Paenibacillus sp. yr247 TaxID=1761880 RepID=UPI0008856754|nr:hypothetical protein [Paenibacillus sp. yr247]SDM85331.1 hypothetical protein SAMN04487897_101259 [Paenibacillus sp. yr247]